MPQELIEMKVTKSVCRSECVCVREGAGRRSVAQLSGRKASHASQQVHTHTHTTLCCSLTVKEKPLGGCIESRCCSSMLSVGCRFRKSVCVLAERLSSHRNDLGRTASAEHCFLSSFSCPGWTCTCSGHWAGWWCQWDRGQQLESGLQHAVCGSRR